MTHSAFDERFLGGGLLAAPIDEVADFAIVGAVIESSNGETVQFETNGFEMEPASVEVVAEAVVRKDAAPELRQHRREQAIKGGIPVLLWRMFFWRAMSVGRCRFNHGGPHEREAIYGGPGMAKL